MEHYKVYALVQLLNLGKAKAKYPGEQYLFESKKCPKTQFVVEYSDDEWYMAIDAMDDEGGVDELGSWFDNDPGYAKYIKWPTEVCVDDWTLCDDMHIDMIKLLEQIHGDKWINQERDEFIALFKESQDE